MSSENDQPLTRNTSGKGHRVVLPRREGSLCNEVAFPSISIPDSIPVLFVSSRPDDHTLLTGLLRSLNCALHHASTCAEAAGVFRQHLITVVITEPSLADGNWMQVQHFCRSLPAAPELIVFSAEGGFFADAPDGAADVLCRPLTEALILGAVALGYLRWRRSSRQSARIAVDARTTHSSVDPERTRLSDPWRQGLRTRRSEWLEEQWATKFGQMVIFRHSPGRDDSIQ